MAGAAQPPSIILLDIDGTIIGDITPQVMLYDLINTIKSHSCTKSAQKVQCPSFPTKELQSKLRDGIVRPHFKGFVQEMQARGVELFIYTASEKKWAEFIVKNIEVAYDIKFNRPLFTRNNCKLINGEYVKSLTHVAPAITKTLNKKFGKKFVVKDVLSRIMVIDNNMVYAKSDSDRVVVCSTYKYRHPENLAQVLNKRIFEAYSPAIHHTIDSFVDVYKPYKNFMRFEKQFYQSYIAALSHTLSCRDDCFRDTMFKTVTLCITHKNISDFNKQTVSYIQHKVNG